MENKEVTNSEQSLRRQEAIQKANQFYKREQLKDGEDPELHEEDKFLRDETHIENQDLDEVDPHNINPTIKHNY